MNRIEQLKVAVAMPMVLPGDIDANIRGMEPLVEEAARQDARGVVCRGVVDDDQLEVCGSGVQDAPQAGARVGGLVVSQYDDGYHLAVLTKRLQ